MNWIEVAIKTTTEGSDIVAQFFYEVGALGVVIEDPSEIIKARVDEHQWDYIDESILNDMGTDVVVKGYLNDDASFADYLKYIEERAKWVLNQDLGMDLGTLEISLESLNDEDWKNNWKQYYKPVKISDRIVIKPSWETYEPNENEVVLEIDPGMAFGTGTHETTILCLKAIDRYLKEGSSVLDIGCGTGILGITAILLGAEGGDAIDIDANAVKTAKENAVRNNVDDRLNVMQGDLLDNVNDKYDFITANIIADVIIDLSKNIKDYLKEDGFFVASGIILERLEEVKKAIEKAGLDIFSHETMGEWAVVVSQKNA